MKDLLVITLALLGLSAQGQEAPRHDKYQDDAQAYCWNPATSGSQEDDPRETRIPAGHYCKSVAPGPKEKSAHQCSCTYHCTINPDGSITEAESDTCLSWCHKDGRRCSCWPEGDPQHPCEGSKGNALVDMNGRVVAVARRK